jgi:Flp pilus assembly protein TadD
MRFRKTLTLLMLVMGLVFALSAWAEQKPFTRDHVQGLVRDGLGDESGAKLIEQRGIDFALAEDFMQDLKAAGASEVFLKALRTAKRPEPASAKKPLNQVQIFALLAGQVTSPRVAMLVRERGIDFEPQQDYLDEVRLGGGDDDLITALKGAKVTKPATVDPAAQARRAEVRQHVARGTQLANKGQYAEAEMEYRAALLLDSQNDDVYVSLAYVLIQQKKWDDAESAAREAVRLNPNDDMAHNNLGAALENKGDLDGGIAEYREALRLNPNLELAHISLGIAIGKNGDWDGAIVEEREALRLNPNNANAHVGLGVALGSKGDWDGEIAEEREALRLNPNSDLAHAGLGVGLELKGDRRGALEEFRAAYMLNPNNATYKEKYESALRKQSTTEAPPTPTPPTQPPRATGEVLTGTKTLCIVQANGSPVIMAEIQKKLLKWGQLTLVSSVNESDLVLVIAQTGQLNTVTGEGNQAAAILKDRHSGAVLWSTTKGGSWSYRGWSNAWVGRAIGDELTKFLTSLTKGGK